MATIEAKVYVNCEQYGLDHIPRSEVCKNCRIIDAEEYKARKAMEEIDNPQTEPDIPF